MKIIGLTAVSARENQRLPIISRKGHHVLDADKIAGNRFTGSEMLIRLTAAFGMRSSAKTGA
jgi:hypothetical protein